MKDQLSRAAASLLGSYVSCVGRTTHVGEDDAYFLPLSAASTKGIREWCIPLVNGDEIRDYLIEPELVTIFPYDKDSGEPAGSFPASLEKHFWCCRTSLKARVDFGETVEERGLRWVDHTMFFPTRYRSPFSLATPNIASHLHVSLDRGKKVFNSTAPVIQLTADATEESYYGFLAYCNSSTVTFWLKQVSHQKQMTGGESVRITSKATVPYQYSGTQIKGVPVPSFEGENEILWRRLVELGRFADEKTRELYCLTASGAIVSALAQKADVRTRWEEFRKSRQEARSALVLIQEEIDFVVYALFDVTDRALLNTIDDISGVDAGSRPFEIRLQANEEGFVVPQKIPDEWSNEVKDVWKKRIEAIDSNPLLETVEASQFKRRWIGRQGKYNRAIRADDFDAALTSWLLDRLENYFDFDGRIGNEGNPTAKIDICLTSVATLTDVARADKQFMEVGEVYRDDPAFDVQRLVEELVHAESVPLLPVLRYKPAGLRKRKEWEKTWELQRREDTIDARTQLPKDDPQYLTEDQAAQDLKQREIGVSAHQNRC